MMRPSAVAVGILIVGIGTGGCASLPEMDLIKAVAEGEVRVVEARIQEGVNVNGWHRVNDRFSYDAIPLVLAASDASCYAGMPLPPCPVSAELVRLLLDAGADPNAWGRGDEREEALFGDDESALMAASEDGNATVVKMLLEAGAEVDARSPSGRTALMAAAYAAGHLRPGRSASEVVRMLLEAGADVHLRMEGSGETALEIATVAGASPAVLADLREHGAKLEWTEDLDRRVRGVADYREHQARESAAIREEIQRQLGLYEGTGTGVIAHAVGAIAEAAGSYVEDQTAMAEARAADEVLIETRTQHRRPEVAHAGAADVAEASDEEGLAALQPPQGHVTETHLPAGIVSGQKTASREATGKAAEMEVEAGTVGLPHEQEAAGKGAEGIGICGVPRDEALAVTKQDSRGEWTAAGPIQELMLSDNETERKALSYVTRNYVTKKNPDTGLWTRVVLDDGYLEPTFVCRVTYKGQTVRLHRLHDSLRSYDEDVRGHISGAPL